MSDERAGAGDNGAATNFKSFDPTSVPPRDDFDADDATERLKGRLPKVRRALKRLPGWIKADRARAFRDMTIRLLTFAYEHDQPAYQRFKEDVRGLSLIRDLERLIRASRRKRTAHDGESAYRETERGIVWEKPTADGDTTPVLLTNFTAAITAVTTRDDGAETERFFDVDADLAGTPCNVLVPAAEFDPMRWTHHLPVNAYVLPGQERRAAVAMRELSRDAGERLLLAHTGWRRVDGKDVYLHGGGAVGSEGSVDGVTVDLGENARWRLVEPQFDHEIADALAASVAVLDLAPLRVTAALLGAVARAALSTADFTLYLHGRTGVFKSELAALAQQHYGPELTARNLISFESTANSLEERAFVLKDALCVIDDYVTNGTPAEVAEMRRKAARIVRAQGNLAGRGRLDRTSKARPARPPRGLVLMTGEDLPTGQSILARLAAVEVERGDVGAAALTVAQELAATGAYAAAIFAYVRHLAADLAGARARHKARVRALLPEFRSPHARTPWIFAELAAALAAYLEFAGATARFPACLAALVQLAGAQERYQRDEAVTTRFLHHLAAAIAAGDAHLADADDELEPPPHPQRCGWRWREINQGQGDIGKVWDAKGSRIGWIQGDDVYLDPPNAYSAAQRHARASGNGELGVKEQTLWKRMKEAGLLASTYKPDATKARATIWGERRNTYIHVRAMFLKTEPTELTEPSPARIGGCGATLNRANSEKLSRTEPPPTAGSLGGSVSSSGNRATASVPPGPAAAESGRKTASCDPGGSVGSVGSVSETLQRAQTECRPPTPRRRRNPVKEKLAECVAHDPALKAVCHGCGAEVWPVSNVETIGRFEYCPRCAAATRSRPRCAWCSSSILPSDGFTATSGGENLHNRCVDAWARAGP